MFQRRHDIDALRALAFLVLILYHASGIWQRGSDFHIVSTYQYDWIEWMRIVINRWRMPLIFVLSGMALALSGAEAAPWRSVMMRSWRLLLPLVFGMWFVVSIQAYCQGVAEGRVPEGFAQFWAIYAQARSTVASLQPSPYGISWNHLWYLSYLWCYTMLLLIMVAARKPRIASPLRRIPIGIWFCLGILWSTACLILVLPRFPETHALFGDWHAHAQYLVFFMAGYLSARSLRFQTWLSQWRWGLLLLALIGITAELGLRAIGRGLLPAGNVPGSLLVLPWGGIERSARALYMWSAVFAILAWGHRWLNRPYRWLPWANDSVYPWYILHQTWLVLIAYWIVPLRLGAGFEIAAVIGGTVLGCWAMSDGVIRGSRWLRPMFGLKPLRAGPRSIAPPARRASRQA